jgi:Big-like domain-containing protein
MSTEFTEADAEYTDAYDAELYDSEAYDAEQSSRDRRRRAQAMAAARRRAAVERGRRPPVPPTPPRPATPSAVVNAVKELDLQTQVQEDSLRSMIAGQNRKVDRASLAAVAAALVPEAFRTFGTPDNAFVRVGIQALPLAILPGGTKRSGVAGVLTTPVVYGGIGLLGLGLIGDQRKRGSSVRTIDVLGPTQLAVGKDDVFVADVFDGSGKPADVPPTWQSDSPGVATVDATTGRVHAVGAGVAVITATAGDVVRRVRLEVVPKPSNQQ